MGAAHKHPERLGDYELVHELKSGGMGSIFLARKRGTGGFEKLAAVKTILSDLRDRAELRTMFLDEARLLARLDHPAVAQVHDFGEEEDTLFLAMEYVAGVPFADLKYDGTPPGVAMRLVAQVCLALHAAHVLRDLEGHLLEVVHRDVSPDNLMLSYDGHVKVLDFGIALMRGRNAPATEFGMIKGKPPYLSPEQVKGRVVDRRSDVWSTGVVLWELLTGRNLFVGDSIFEIALAVDEQDIPLPSAVAGQLPDGLDEIVMRALSRNVEERYQSALDMAEDLEQLAASISAPSLADFAGAALADKRAQHREWLRSVLGGTKASAPTGRATGMHTVPAAVLVDEEAPPARAGSGALASKTLSDATIVDPATPFHGSRVFRRSTYLTLLAVLGVVAGAAWMLVKASNSGLGAGPDAAVVAALVDDAALAVPALVETPPVVVIDASVPAPVVVDASVGKSRHSGRNKTGHSRPTTEPTHPVPNAKDPPPTDVAPAGTGTITIAAEPYALVRLNGKEIGATPQLRKSYPAGTYVIELMHPDTGVLRLRKTIQLAPGGHKSVIAR